MTPTQTATLRNWYRQGNFLYGLVYGHPEFADGTPVRTSTVVEQCDGYAITQNTRYTLEGPPRYVNV